MPVDLHTCIHSSIHAFIPTRIHMYLLEMTAYMHTYSHATHIHTTTQILSPDSMRRLHRPRRPKQHQSHQHAHGGHRLPLLASIVLVLFLLNEYGVRVSSQQPPGACDAPAHAGPQRGCGLLSHHLPEAAASRCRESIDYPRVGSACGCVGVHVYV